MTLALVRPTFSFFLAQKLLLYDSSVYAADGGVVTFCTARKICRLRLEYLGTPILRHYTLLARLSSVVYQQTSSSCIYILLRVKPTSEDDTSQRAV